MKSALSGFFLGVIFYSSLIGTGIYLHRDIPCIPRIEVHLVELIVSYVTVIIMAWHTYKSTRKKGL